MKSSKKLQISSHLLFVYINNQDRKWRMSVLVFSSTLGVSTLIEFLSFFVVVVCMVTQRMTNDFCWLNAVVKLKCVINHLSV